MLPWPFNLDDKQCFALPMTHKLFAWQPILDVFIASPISITDMGPQYNKDLSPSLSPNILPQAPSSYTPPQGTFEVVDVDSVPFGAEVSLSISHTEWSLVSDCSFGARIAPRGGKTALRSLAATIPLGTRGTVMSMSSLMKCAPRPSPNLIIPGHTVPTLEGVATVCAQCLTASLICIRLSLATPPVS